MYPQAQSAHNPSSSSAKSPIYYYIEYAQSLLNSSEDDSIKEAKWNQFYNELSPLYQKILWEHANWHLPEIKNTFNKKLIDKIWGNAFYKTANLRRIAGNCALSAKKGYGIIYFYIIDNQIRYIGQTRERTLKWRMNRPQKNGVKGYNYAIKRNLINAYRNGTLSIRTAIVKKDQLDRCEQQLIEHYGPTNKLWNKIHNEKYFQVENYNF